MLQSPLTCTQFFLISSISLFIFFQRNSLQSSSMAASPRSLRYQFRSSLPDVPPRSPSLSVSFPKLKPADSETTSKIVLQPRLCTLRSFGSDPLVPIKSKRVSTRDDATNDDVSPFFATLSEYIESSKDSHEFEIISGRLAMVSFMFRVLIYLMKL